MSIPGKGKEIEELKEMEVFISMVFKIQSIRKDPPTDTAEPKW